MNTTTTIHVGTDGLKWEIWSRGNDEVCVFLGRDAGRKKTRLRAAGFGWQRAGWADDVADAVLPGAGWISDGLGLPECAARGPNATALLALAKG